MSELSATTTGTQDAGRPVVGIVMGSDSDWPVMGAAAEVLDEFKVAYEADVVSAHRMPTEMIDYGRAAAERGADQPSSSGSPALCALNAPQWERWAGRVAGPQSTEQSPR